MKGKNLTLNYSLLQGSYWMSYCALYSFATVYLLSKGFNSAMIGMIVAGSNILSSVLQPYVSTLADQAKKLSIRQIILMVAAVLAILLAGLTIVPSQLLLVGLLFIFANIFLQVLQPLINAMSFYYIRHGMKIDFGLARGTGSLAFAILSSILGFLLSKFASWVIPFSSLICVGLIVLLMLSFPMIQKMSAEVAHDENPNHVPGGSFMYFIKEYPSFCFVLIGSTCLFIYHNMFNGYLIQVVEALHGTSKELGTTMSLAAMVEIPTMFLFSKIVAKYSSHKLLVFASIMFTVKAIATIFAVNIPILYATQIFQMFAFALFTPASVYYTNQMMKPQDQFKGQAYLTMTITMGGVLGSLLGGFILQYSSVSMMLIVCAIVSAIGTFFVAKFAKEVKNT